MNSSISRAVAKAALRMALTDDRDDEQRTKRELAEQKIAAAAVDFGGDYQGAVRTIVERAVVAAKREGVIEARHAAEGAVAGAAHEAVSQLATKALGLGVGGKIGVARRGDHLAVAAFFGIGLLHLDEVGVGLGHRAISG